MISRDALPIKRHRDPLGIFSRMFIYPLIGVGAWRHRLELVLAGVTLEALLWTAVPPVDETFGFVEDAIDVLRNATRHQGAPHGREQLE